MLTCTSFGHVVTQARIFVAMRKALLSRKPSTLLNRKGKAYVKCQYVGGYGHSFRFTDLQGRDVTKAVYKGLKL